MHATPPTRLAGAALVAAPLVAILGLASGCEDEPPVAPNTPPRVHLVAPSVLSVVAGNPTTLVAQATDDDRDDLIYSWSADGGQFALPTGATARWTPPDVPGDYRVRVRVSDGIAFASAYRWARVVADDFAGPTTISSTPIGAEIYLDGRNTLLRTPHTFPRSARISSGAHTFSARLPGRLLFPDTVRVDLAHDEPAQIVLRFPTTDLAVSAGAETSGGFDVSARSADLVWSERSGDSFMLWVGDVSEAGPIDAVPVPLVGHSGEVLDPTWKSSERIVFHDSNDDLGARILEVFTSEGTIRELVLGRDARHPTLTAVATRLAFVRHRVEPEGGFVTELVEALDNDARYDDPVLDVLASFASESGRVQLSRPSYSLDGRLVAFSWRAPGEPDRLGVYAFESGRMYELDGAEGLRAPVFGHGNTLIFERVDPATGKSLGLEGAALDRDAWTLGRRMPLVEGAASAPAYGRTVDGVVRLVCRTPEGLLVVRGIQD